MKPLVWFTFEQDGRTIPVILTAPKLSRQLGKTEHGATFGFADGGLLQAIYINAKDSRETQDWVLFHELVVHGVLWETSFRRSIKNEEGFAHALGPRATALLKQVGFSWPRRPRGAAKLENWARRYAAR